MAKTIDEALLSALKYGGLDKSNLSEIVGIIDKFNSKGIRPHKVFPLGIPYPDGVTMQASLDLPKLHTLLDELLKLPRIEHVKVFPKGIPYPDIFHVEIGIR
jgi:hypothetical protein